MLDMGGKRQPGGRERKGHKLCYAMPRKPLAFPPFFSKGTDTTATVAKPLQPRSIYSGKRANVTSGSPFQTDSPPESQSVSEKCHLTTKVAL